MYREDEGYVKPFVSAESILEKKLSSSYIEVRIRAAMKLPRLPLEQAVALLASRSQKERSAGVLATLFEVFARLLNQANQLPQGSYKKELLDQLYDTGALLLRPLPPAPSPESWIESRLWDQETDEVYGGLV